MSWKMRFLKSLSNLLLNTETLQAKKSFQLKHKRPGQCSNNHPPRRSRQPMSRLLRACRRRTNRPMSCHRVIPRMATRMKISRMKKHQKWVLSNPYPRLMISTSPSATKLWKTIKLRATTSSPFKSIVSKSLKPQFHKSTVEGIHKANLTKKLVAT